MKPKKSSDPEDQPLSDALGQWQVTAALPPRFQENVWQRIAQAETKASPWQSCAGWIDIVFRRPVLAVSYAAILFFAGITAGLWQAHDHTRHDQALARVAYVQSVDPYLKFHH